MGSAGGRVCGTGTARRPVRRWRRRLADWWQDYRWHVIGVMWLGALALGYCGFRAYYLAAGEHYGVHHLLYLALQLFILESGWSSGPTNWAVDTARLLAPAVAAYTALEGLALVFSEQWQMLQLRFVSGHVIVCGVGHEGSRLAKTFCQAGYRVVAVENDPANPDLAEISEQGIPVLVADATRAETLVRARTRQAKYLIAACGDDGVNAEIAVRAKGLTRRRQSGALTCFVSIADLDVCELLREKEFATEYSPAFRLEFFSILERGARALLAAYPPFGSEAQPGDGPPHVLVIGLGRLGESLLVQAARKWRWLHGQQGARLRITAVDLEARGLGEALLVKWPDLAETLDVALVDMDVRSADFRRGGFLSDGASGCSVTIVYVCLPEDSLALSAALALHRQCRARGSRARIVVRMGEQTGLAALLSASPWDEGEFGNIQAFPLVDEACRPDLLTLGVNESLARSVHEGYLQGELEEGRPLGPRPALCPWEELTEELKEANREQAAHVARALHEFGYKIVPVQDARAAVVEFPEDVLENMARAEHERWCGERQRAGWRHGPKRDDRRRAHPDLVGWEDLPESSRAKCRRIVRSLPASLARIGFGVEPLERTGQDGGASRVDRAPHD